MTSIFNQLIGSLEEKREWKQNETRAKKLPKEYATAYKEIKNYIFHTSGIMTFEPLKALVDMLEDAAANNRRVLDVTGPDVAAFADELVRGEKSYHEQQRKKLNKSITDKLGENSK